MASAFGHAFSALALGTTFNKNLFSRKFYVLGMVASILPDADVITFAVGIPYESIWGHRGISHSILVALVTGILFAFLFYRNIARQDRIMLITYFFLCTLSHGLLDALTDGGLGVAFFAPLENNRYFFPWRPIQVSPIGVENFFSVRGIQVILSELLWIGIPGIILIITSKYVKKLKAN